MTCRIDDSDQAPLRRVRSIDRYRTLKVKDHWRTSRLKSKKTHSKTRLGSPAVVWSNEQYYTIGDGPRFLGIFVTEREAPATELVPVIKAAMLKMGPGINSFAALVN